jgi:ATP-dependent RNA helicase DOB1
LSLVSLRPLPFLNLPLSQVARVSKECGLPVEEEAYLKQFQNIMMGITYEWCCGKSFAEICKMTDMFEGSIIRNFRRLDELLQYVPFFRFFLPSLMLALLRS